MRKACKARFAREFAKAFCDLGKWEIEKYARSEEIDRISAMIPMTSLDCPSPLIALTSVVLSEKALSFLYPRDIA